MSDAKLLPDVRLRWTVITGLLVVAAVFGGLTAWSLMAPIDGAVIATGNVQVESNRKTVKHLEGGIVAELRVREGTYVEAGDLLIRLDDAVDQASLALIDSQLDELRARRARLVAEQNDVETLALPDALTERAHLPQVRDVVDGQTNLSEARRETRTAEKGLLLQRIEQLKNQIGGFRAQQKSQEKQIALLEQELGGLRQLYEKGYAPITRILALEREVERLRGERGAHIAEIARTQSSIGEAEMEIVRSDKTFREEVITELREVEAKLIELSEQRIAVVDRLKRRDIVAPQAGFVLDLQAHTVGGVIAAGEPIMDIVPGNDALVIAAQVQPQDIDKIQVGSEARIRLSAFNQRTTPEIFGRVKTVSGDRLLDATTGLPYYLAFIEMPADTAEQLNDLSLVPGMPAESFIRTGERTAISYFLKPLTDSFARAFKED